MTCAAARAVVASVAVVVGTVVAGAAVAHAFSLGGGTPPSHNEQRGRRQGKAGTPGGEAHEKREVDALKVQLEAIGARLKPTLGFLVRAKRCEDTAPVPRGAKKIHFIRHGQGYHNVAQKEWREAKKPGEPYTIDRPDAAKYKDALLTPFGREQAEELRARAALLSPELMVVSPLRRATETGLIAFSDHVRGGMPVVANELCHEIAGAHTCDCRVSKSELMKTFPEVDYSLITDEEDPFWGDGKTRETSEQVADRCVQFVRWLKDLPQSHLVVAVHSQFLFTLFNAVLSIEKDEDSCWFGTGEMRSMILTYEDGA